MPAAAVIPAPIAYIKVVAVKKLVVGSRQVRGRFVSKDGTAPFTCVFDGGLRVLFTECPQTTVRFTLKKLECSKQASSLNICAWNNGIGSRFYFVGFRKLT